MLTKAIVRRVRPEVMTEYHSSLALQYLFRWLASTELQSAGMWKGCLRAQDRNSGSRPIRDVYGPGLTCIHHQLYLDVPECFVIFTSCLRSLPSWRSPPHFPMISTRTFLLRNTKQAEVSKSSGLRQTWCFVVSCRGSYDGLLLPSRPFLFLGR